MIGRGRSHDRGKVFYEKVVFSCAGRLITSFALLYSVADRDTFDPIIERIEDQKPSVSILRDEDLTITCLRRAFHREDIRLLADMNG